MSKMGNELERLLDENKYPLLEVCRRLLAQVDKTGYTWVEDIVDLQVVVNRIDKLK